MLTSFTEIVNFATSQYYFSYNGNGFGSFSGDIANYKILYFLTTLYITATAGDPVELDISYSILNASHYTHTLTVGYNVSITGFAFSQIMYNLGNSTVDTSPHTYGLEWSIADSSFATNIFGMDSIIAGNQLFFGLKSFTTLSGQDGLTFTSVLGNHSGTYGIQVEPTVYSNQT